MSTDNKKTNNPLMVEQKKKHHLWGLWIPLIVIFAIIVVPLGLALALFYDPSHVDTGITEKKEQQLVFGDIMTEMFDGCRNNEDPSIDLKIKQQQLNQLLYNVSSDLPEQAKQFLKQFSVKITDDSYIFDLEISAYNVAKTHIKLETTVKVGADIGGELGYLFEITNLKVGRLGGIKGLLPWLMDTAGFKLDDVFKSAGLSMKFDKENLSLTYTYSDFVNDLSRLSGGTDKMFLDIFSNFFTGGYISFEHHTEQDVTGSIKMSKFMNNMTYGNSDYLIKKSFEDEQGNKIPYLTKLSNDVEKMISDGIITGDLVNNSKTVMQFLAFGKEYVKTTELAYINSIYDRIKDTYCGGKDIDTYSSDVKTAYFGAPATNIVNQLSDEINEKLNAMTPADKTALLLKIKDEKEGYVYDFDNPLIVTDQDIHPMLKSNTQLVGYGFNFVNGSKVSYTMLDNVYPTIKKANPEVEGSKDIFSLVFGLNINGCETSLVMPMEATKIDVGGMHGLSFSVEKSTLYFGEERFPALKEQISSIMSGIQDGDMIRYTKKDGKVTDISMVFDFDSYLNDPANAGTPFVEFNALATSAPYNAKMVVDFEFRESEGNALGKVAGEFAVKFGYKQAE